jgi:hypothetical protein
MVSGMLAIDQNIHAGKPDFSEYCGGFFIEFKDSTAERKKKSVLLQSNLNPCIFAALLSIFNHD